MVQGQEDRGQEQEEVRVAVRELKRASLPVMDRARGGIGGKG
jgi:hypothetical protein